MPPKLAISLHLYHLGIFLFKEKRRKKKRISSGFVGCFFFWLSRFLTGVFLVEQCLERETDTKTSPTLDFALRRGPRERKALITYSVLPHTVCVSSPLLVLRVSLVAFGSHFETDTSNLVLFFLSCFPCYFFVCWRRWEFLEILPA
jgi:hypothetical protein